MYGTLTICDAFVGREEDPGSIPASVECSVGWW